ncbi:MAG: transporter substrate-binding domain-containing protein [Pseudomonadales bacterium]
MRQLTKLLLLIASFTLATSAFANQTLRIGVSPNYQPLAYKQDGQLTGIDIAAGETIAQQMGRKAEFVEMAFEQLIPALQAGKIDIIMSGMTHHTGAQPAGEFSAIHISAPDKWRLSATPMPVVLVTKARCFALMRALL